METLVSLTIVCFMTMLPTLAIHRWQETLKIEQFLATVEKTSFCATASNCFRGNTRSLVLKNNKAFHFLIN